MASDSIGEEKEVRIGIVPFDKLEPNLREFADLPDHGKYAVIEMSSIAGLSDLPPERAKSMVNFNGWGRAVTC